MGACREGFNLFHKMGRRNFFKHGIFGNKWAREYVLKDTLGRYICAIFGHSRVFQTDDFPPKIVCVRCTRVVYDPEGE